ncbi:MAG: ATP-dependent metallopeptidase FtsH/Yme1/Tma family protein, partial [Candidatus Microthrix parvicella]
MAEQTRPPQPSGQGKQPNAGGQSSGGFLGGKLPSWSMFVLLAVVIGSVLWFSSAEPKSNELRYDQLVTQIKQDKIESVTWDNTTGKIEGTFA